MNFDLDDRQREFASAAADFFSGQNCIVRARELLDEPGLPAPGLRQLADLGLYGITVSEADGGLGAAVLDMAVVAEQAGRVLAAPSLVTAARAAVLLEGQPELSALAAGTTAFAVVDGDAQASAPSIDAAFATEFLALDGQTLVIGSADVTVGTPIDPTRGLATVALRSPRVIRHDTGALWERARQIGTVIMAAEDLGSADAALRMAIEHAKTRHTFGRAIGSYQTIKHRLVDAWIGVDQLRSLVWWAAWAADNAADNLPLAASAAKAYSATVFEQVAEMLIQLHGGIGFTWEHDAHLFWRRAKVDRLLLGDDVDHLGRVADLALAGADVD